MKKVAQNTFDVKRDELKGVIDNTLKDLNNKMQQAVQQLNQQVNTELTKIVDNLSKEVETQLDELRNMTAQMQAQQAQQAAEQTAQQPADDDKVPGGKGDNLDKEDVDKDELKKGIKVELEHTDDKKLAEEIALDHLAEDPRYYTNLEKVHKEAFDLPGVVKESKKKGKHSLYPTPEHPAPRGEGKLPPFWKRNLDYPGESPWVNMDLLKKITDQLPKKKKRKKAALSCRDNQNEE